MRPSTIRWLFALLLISFCWAEDDSDDCECAPYFLCRGGIINDNGSELIDVRSLSLHRDHLQSKRSADSSEDYHSDSLKTCSHYLETCCKPPKQQPDVDSVVVPTNNSSVERNIDEQPKAKNVSFPIIKSNKTETGAFAWSVVILEEDKEYGNHLFICGGSIIHPQIVLTAAHCIASEDSSRLEVRAGDWIANDTARRQDRRVQRAILHKDFDRKTLFNDFALLVLSEPLVLDSSVNIAYLPEASDHFDHSRCFANGWGKSRTEKKDYFKRTFKRIELPMVPREQCQAKLRTTRLGKYFKLHSSFVCAGGESSGKDTCDSDGGFSLVCPMTKDHPEPRVLVGIVAWGVGEWGTDCGSDELPGVYANVAAARSWIDRQATQAGFALDKYHQR